jgi:hypothetical protein
VLSCMTDPPYPYPVMLPTPPPPPPPTRLLLTPTASMTPSLPVPIPLELPLLPPLPLNQLNMEDFDLLSLAVTVCGSYVLLEGSTMDGSIRVLAAEILLLLMLLLLGKVFVLKLLG